VTGFLGPNGAGKTTTLRMLLGLVTPTAGTATIDGQPYAELASPFRHVGAVLEADGFHPGRRARDHLRVLAVAAGLRPDRVEEVLDQVDLADAAERRVKGFSLGMPPPDSRSISASMDRSSAPVKDPGRFSFSTNLSPMRSTTSAIDRTCAATAWSWASRSARCARFWSRR
jgi:hypothetical protein